MAGEEKKQKKSDSHGESSSMPFADTLFWALFILVLFAVLGSGFNYILKAINLSLSIPNITSIIAIIFNKFQIFSIFFSLAFFIGIVYCNFKLGELAHAHHGHTGTHDEGPHGEEALSHKKDLRWQNILDKINSSNESDWRLAIIEADIILGDMLLRMGYKGEGVAEKLKQVEPSDFKTLQSAWEAHKIRNNIAHSGSSYHLSKSEAERAINLFKEVFEEFFFI